MLLVLVCAGFSSPLIFKGLLEGETSALAVELKPRFWVAIDVHRGGLLKMWRGSLESSRDGAGKAVLRSRGKALLEALPKESIWAIRHGGGEKLSPRILGLAAREGELSLLYEAHRKKPKFRIHELIKTRSVGAEVVGIDRIIETSKIPKEWTLYFICPPGDWQLWHAFWEDYTESLHLVGLWTNQRARARFTFANL